MRSPRTIDAGITLGFGHTALGSTQPSASQRSMALRILGFGTYDLARHPRVGILLDGLRAAGDDVEEANDPLGFTTSERVAVLAKPWRAAPLARRLVQRWASVARQARAVDRRAPVDAVIVGYLGHFDVVLARLLFPRRCVVLDLLVFAADTARDRGATNRLLLASLGALDRLAVACADVVVVDTDEHLALLPVQARPKAVVAPVGASQEWFDASPRLPAGARQLPAVAADLKVVFYGLYTPLQGATVIGEALALLGDRPGIAVTMIGQGQDTSRTKQLAGAAPGVTWLDWVDPVELPALVGRHEVCLGIFATTAKAQRVVPNKVFQGAAAKCAIVTSATGPQRRALGDAAVFVPPGDPERLAATLRDLAADRPRLLRLRAAASARAEAAFRPECVAAPLRVHLEARADPTSARQTSARQTSARSTDSGR